MSKTEALKNLRAVRTHLRYERESHNRHGNRSEAEEIADIMDRLNDVSQWVKTLGATEQNQ